MCVSNDELRLEGSNVLTNIDWHQDRNFFPCMKKSMRNLFQVIDIYSIGRVTSSWGPLLKRILKIVDAISGWTEDIIETLYVHTNGQVDKPIPVIGDYLAVYLVEGRLYKNSAQGWYVVQARKFKFGDLSRNPHFWCLCEFSADIPPVPDTAVPWRGLVDPWEQRQKLENRPIWIRLCATEIDGCSYYNLSDWIMAKRIFYDGKPSMQQSPANDRRVKGVVCNFKRQRRRTNQLSEYITFDSASSESSCSTSSRPMARLLPMMTTGKMSCGDRSSISTTTSHKKRLEEADENDGQSILSMPRYLRKSDWLQLRQNAQGAIFLAIKDKITPSQDQSNLARELSLRLEQETIFSKCKLNQDMYEGLTRSVSGILTRFESIVDSLEILIHVDDKLKEALLSSPDTHSPSATPVLGQYLITPENPFIY